MLNRLDMVRIFYIKVRSALYFDLPVNIIELRELCTHSPISILHTPTIPAPIITTTPKKKSGNSLRGVSISQQFKSSLQQLNAELNRCAPHYVRYVSYRYHVDVIILFYDVGSLVLQYSD